MECSHVFKTSRFMSDAKHHMLERVVVIILRDSEDTNINKMQRLASRGGQHAQDIQGAESPRVSVEARPGGEGGGGCRGGAR